MGSGGDAVQNRVRHQLAFDAQIPLVGFQLRRDYGAPPPFPRLHDLEQVHGVLGGDRRGPEVVNDEQLHFLVCVHLLEVAPVLCGSCAVQVVADARG